MSTPRRTRPRQVMSCAPTVSMSVEAISRAGSSTGGPHRLLRWYRAREDEARDAPVDQLVGCGDHGGGAHRGERGRGGGGSLTALALESRERAGCAGSTIAVLVLLLGVGVVMLGLLMIVAWSGRRRKDDPPEPEAPAPEIPWWWKLLAMLLLFAFGAALVAAAISGVRRVGSTRTVGGLGLGQALTGPAPGTNPRVRFALPAWLPWTVLATRRRGDCRGHCRCWLSGQRGRRSGVRPGRRRRRRRGGDRRTRERPGSSTGRDRGVRRDAALAWRTRRCPIAGGGAARVPLPRAARQPSRRA